jgi:hypothetical protein
MKVIAVAQADLLSARGSTHRPSTPRANDKSTDGPTEGPVVARALQGREREGRVRQGTVAEGTAERGGGKE